MSADVTENQGVAADKMSANGEAPEVTELRADARYMANVLERLRLTLEMVTDELSDEGGRVYLGHTNHADDLKEVSEKVEGLSWDRILRGKKQPDLYADLRGLRNDQIMLQARIKELIAEASSIHDEREALRDALVEIDGNGASKEPSATATVGFAKIWGDRGVDPEQADEAIEQAFNEGLVRGIWLMAEIARTSLKSERSEPACPAQVSASDLNPKGAS